MLSYFRILPLTLAQLKPCCVKISQLAIRQEEDAPTGAQELIQLTNELLATLNEQVQQNPTVLDDKLAEYVFFPLYHIFRQMGQYPMPLIETCVKCLTLLIIHGWKAKLSPKLVQQILNLLTFIIDGVPSSDSTEKRDVPEETILESFRGLTALLTTAGTSPTAASGLAESDAIPALGHSVSVMLSGITDGPTPQVQQEALRSIQATYVAIKEHAALASFLPGTISSLAKVTSTSGRYKKTVLAKCLSTVSLVLTRVLADLRTRSILSKTEDTEEAEDEKGKLLSPAWLRATVAQVKRALSTIMKLRTHESVEVRQALNKLCIVLLDECHKTLENCASFLVETAIILDSSDEGQGLWTETSLRDLVSIYPNLGEIVKSTVYNWMTSLPRIMQGGDEDAKQAAVRNLAKGLELVKGLHIESSTLEDLMSSTLRDCIVSLIQTSKSEPVQEASSIQLIDDGDSTGKSKYPPILMSHESQKGVRTEIMSLVKSLGSAAQQTKLATTMLEHAQEPASAGQIAAFWLCFQLVRAGHEASADTDLFLDLASITNPSDDPDMVFNNLYSTSVQILDDHTDGGSVDWRFEAIALEIIAYTAQRSGTSFRPELIDVLFPIATFLGSTNQKLRSHAMVTLNSIAASCGYDNVSEMMISNVDYMVNSVALRLNTLDISPASINVLKMMIRLAGPRLIPYLDDVVESIFSSLDNYHGYPLFVESLFTVLKEVVDQGVRSNMLLLPSQQTSSSNHLKKRPNVDGMQSLMDTLTKRKTQGAIDKVEMQDGHPQTPWKSGGGEIDEDGEAGTESHGEDAKSPNTPTYQLLLRVADLTQHYLTSPTPTLRRSLLELLATAAGALAPDEESFLPLVNSIWPVVIERLRDPEPFIAVEACRALSGLCAASGDFLNSRFKTEWDDWLRDWCRKAKIQASLTPARARPHGEDGHLTKTGGGEGNLRSQILIPIRGENLSSGELSHHLPVSQYSGGLGQFASPVKIWEAIVDLLTSIVSYVRVDDDMFDEILDLLSDILGRNKKVREALETINRDAVWLARYERGSVEWLEAPRMDGVQFVEMTTVS